MANKIRFGLRNARYALWDAETKKYSTPKAIPGSVSLTFSREGGDNTDFYADDGIYYTFAGTNGGYSGDLEIAKLTDEMRVDLLGEIKDETSGVQYEVTQVNPPQFALIFEMQGDQNPMGFVFYSCKANRPDIAANTKGENPDVDTDTLNIRIDAQEFTIGGKTQNVVQGHIEKSADNATKFDNFFSAVAIPGTASA